MKIPASHEISIRCICCDKPLKPEWKSEHACPASSDAWDGAAVDRIVVGYGSKHDTRVFIVGICDECLSAKLESKAVHLCGSYQESPLTRDDAKKLLNSIEE